MSLGFRHELRRELLDLNLRGVVLSRHGRLSRVAFAGVAFLVALLSMPIWYAVVVLWGLAEGVSAGISLSVGIPFMAALALINAYPAACVVVKRLHDMDRTGLHAWWIMPPLAGGTACWMIGSDGWTASVVRGSAVLALAFLVLAPGSPDTNSHGTVDNWG